MKTNPDYSRPTDIKLISQALEKAKPWGLEAEFAWSLAVQTALDDWDLDD